MLQLLFGRKALSYLSLLHSVDRITSLYNRYCSLAQCSSIRSRFWQLPSPSPGLESLPPASILGIRLLKTSPTINLASLSALAKSPTNLSHSFLSLSRSLSSVSTSSSTVPPTVSVILWLQHQRSSSHTTPIRPSYSHT